MSLFKARKLTSKEFKFKANETKEEFNKEIDDFVDVPCDGGLRMMLFFYSIYSVIYLKEVSQSLKPNAKMRDELSLMNSFIVEACTTLGQKYIHREHGYTLVDKTVNYLLDNSIDNFANFIQETMEDINNSYIEQE